MPADGDTSRKVAVRVSTKDGMGLRPLSHQAVAGLVLILLAFSIVRLPLLLRQPGGQDEEYYAFPGLTIVRDGLPRLPHVPQRDPASCFYRADEVFFAEPPLYFYWQSLFYALFPPTYGTARLASFTASLAALSLLFALSARLFNETQSALWGTGLYALSRVFYFPATTARPDLLCTAIGLAVLPVLVHWRRTSRRRELIAAGLLIGLGGLTHPFALVYAIQAAVWVYWSSPTRRLGLLRTGLMAGVSLLTFAAWLPLILRYPDHFWKQFGNNVLAPSGPGLIERLVWPWPSLEHHAVLLWTYLGPIQVVLMGAGLLAATGIALRRNPDLDDAAATPDRFGLRTGVLLAWSAVLLTAILSGEHPAHGYWSYAGGLVFLCLGRVVTLALAYTPAAAGGAGHHECSTTRSPRRALTLASAALLVLLMLPGAGLRTWFSHLRNWKNEDYRGPAFAARLLSELPADARFAVDTEFVLDFYAAGRQTVIAEINPFYLTTSAVEYDYLILSRRGLDRGMRDQLPGSFVRSVGNREELFSCYAEIYVRQHEATAENHQ